MIITPCRRTNTVRIVNAAMHMVRSRKCCPDRTAGGLRPCSGAILLLVFALAQGLFWLGVVSTFVMGLGTALTVAAIATFAVAAGSFARKLATLRGGIGSLVLRGLELGASFVVVAFGLLLLMGYMASERLFGA
jgi:nickel/cobalt exporter